MPLIDLTAREYLLAALCPYCRHQPTDRYSAGTVERAASFPPDDLYRDERCSDCGKYYLLAWVAVAHAFPAERTSQEVKPWAA